MSGLVQKPLPPITDSTAQPSSAHVAVPATTPPAMLPGMLSEMLTEMPPMEDAHASEDNSMTPTQALDGCVLRRVDDMTFLIERSMLVPACGKLRDAGWEHLCSITGIDWKTSWEVVYHLVKFGSRDVVTLKVPLQYHDPRVPSVTRLWPGAGWHERETYDLLGITFSGNNDLRRILLPDDFNSHPLRKDFLLEKETFPPLFSKGPDWKGGQ